MKGGPTVKRSRLVQLVLLVLVVVVASAVVASFAFGSSTRMSSDPTAVELTLDGTTLNISSFNTGVSNPVTTGSAQDDQGSGAAKPNFADLNLQTSVDANFPPLFLAAAQGKRFQKAVLRFTFTSAGNLEALTATLTNVGITSISLGGAAGAGAPSENLALNYGTVAWSFFANGDTTGTPTSTGGWDIVANHSL